jgi:phage host-nuclease inhibitor protein Gam
VVESYCEQHRSRLTDNGKRKSAPFAAGEGIWRKGRSTVEIVEDLKEKVLSALKKKGLQRMIRVKEEINKTAVQNEAELVKGIKGLSVMPGAESFSVKPVGAELVERPPQ